MNFHSILALTDLSAQGNRAVLRAAMFAAQQRALLKIMYAPSELGGSANPNVEQEVKRLAAEIYTRFDILVKNVADASGHLQAVAEEARWADLVVVGEHRKNSANAFFCGQPIERLQRIVPCPILLARLEVFHRYRRILVALDSTPSSRKMLILVRSLDRNAEIEPFHAISDKLGAKLRDKHVPEQAMKTYQHESTGNPQTHLFRASDSSTARRNRIAVMIGKSDVARQAVIQQQHSNAELIVVGKRRSSGFSDFLFGSLAHRILWWSKGDVLLVPHDLRIEPKPETDATGRRQMPKTEHAPHCQSNIEWPPCGDFYASERTQSPSHF